MGRDPGRCQHTGKSPELTLAEGPAHASHSSGHSSPSVGRGHQVRGQHLQEPFTLELTAFFPNEQRFPLPSALSEQTRAAPGLVKSGEAQPHHGDVPCPSQTLKSPFPKQNLSFQRSSAAIGDTVCGEPPPPRTARTAGRHRKPSGTSGTCHQHRGSGRDWDFGPKSAADPQPLHFRGLRGPSIPCTAPGRAPHPAAWCHRGASASRRPWRKSARCGPWLEGTHRDEGSGSGRGPGTHLQAGRKAWSKGHSQSLEERWRKVNLR